MIVLHLTLKRKWFDMIFSGEKREEYREIKPYWNTRLLNRHYDAVKFRNGYSKDAPWMQVKLTRILNNLGNIEWGAQEGKGVYILRLGAILEFGNIRQHEGAKNNEKGGE